MDEQKPEIIYRTPASDLQSISHKSWFARHLLAEILGIVLAGAVLAAGYYFFIAKSNSEETSNDGQVCIQVIAEARNPQTGEIKQFPTPCDVPEGWVRE
ncbi:MAG: hypothetical protein A3I07_03090 [Candidatus Doudnabacteria bacterium RIFCSPLOWO2_02_FULL_42_9]|uniref:Uncharacterized protein n=1 Tax=Candidatus Doudnabacteria bacterium RIFCSPHIGHO2_01_FULL_41_86 TaxID=1817821 RepID=A0A1F5N9G1_9BACT|nr:MAG: hypothetical protein A2717_01520 [Candidatus Doudnabacteria bacterium RIFCSPHIGHO2_01_FULL_41_86]OGE75046.1 MAG: hypothetical protein A3K07_04730 [Candidatus Doudnabacteria bacterium RIFCSPHIGHO2_01_43_10]OGE85247.1 MAG: hypothetical protein A3E28_01090 [Candidatus Doudnabacteria bacterium RIFCSPHIGHO2_12_FULL_42_22]OGE86785.1 MAG: hypothetical protein A3C49_01925 [Candidatus Doudnabacteria bacterium RIFCSPHIGHO2_02_FULL_42_25]OGE92384.1 MAG: hypothetical protein A2895_02080 [Candidatus